MALATLLAERLNVTESHVLTLLQRAPLLYKVYKIPKRTFGMRTIAQPTPQLKELQRTFLSIIKFPVHPAATAYQPGTSIRDNARHHVSNRYLLKMDLNNFFNSITREIVWQQWKQALPMPEASDKAHIERLLFWAPQRTLNSRMVLSVGAPSSPTLSNFVMYQFDEQVVQLCLEERITYTRYADDLTFSTNKRNALFSLPGQITLILAELFAGQIIINKRKTVFSSKAHNRHVTGICLSNQNKLSLGRAKKRYLKHLVHQHSLGYLTADQTRQLQGRLAHAQHIEPTFIQALRAKYGAETLRKIGEIKND